MVGTLPIRTGGLVRFPHRRGRWRTLAKRCDKLSASLRKATGQNEQLEQELLTIHESYKGKVLNAKFYAHNVLPSVAAIAAGITSGDNSCMDEALFKA